MWTAKNKGLRAILESAFAPLQHNCRDRGTFWRETPKKWSGKGGRSIFLYREIGGAYGFLTSNLICLRMPASFGISVVPVGNLLALKMNARMSAFC